MMIRLRSNSETLKYGEFRPLGAKGNVIAYERVLGSETYRVVLNFSRKTGKLKSLAGMTAGGSIVTANTGRTGMTNILQPYEAVVLKITKEAGV
jgi:hypothetical protein